MRWIQVPASERDAHVEKLIVAAGDPVPGHELEFLNHHAPPLDRVEPFKLVVGQQSLTRYVCHAVGDAYSINKLVSAVLTMDERMLTSLERRVGAPAVLFASAHQCVRAPRSTWRAARVGRSGSFHGTVHLPIRSSAPPQPVRGNGNLGPTVVATSLAASVGQDVREWRDAEMPGVSVASIFATATFLALQDAGISVDPRGFHALVDTRRYFGRRIKAKAGNLAKGLDLVADMNDPMAVANALRSAITSPRPVLSMLLSVLKASSLATRKPGDRSPRETGAIESLTLNFSWVPVELGHLAWIAGSERRSIRAGRSPNRHGISVTVFPSGSNLDISASFHSGAADPGRVLDALTRLQDVRSLLQSAVTAV